MSENLGDRRRQATRAKVRVAVLELLKQHDYGGLTYERIAATSGVAKTTLYRHWPSKAELVFDLVLHDRDLPPLEDRGSAEGEIHALADRVVEFVGGGPARAVFPGVIADMAADPALQDRFHEVFIVGSQPLIAGPLERLSATRPAASTLSASEFQAVIVGAAFFWTYAAALPLPAVRERAVSLIHRLIPEE